MSEKHRSGQQRLSRSRNRRQLSELTWAWSLVPAAAPSTPLLSHKAPQGASEFAYMAEQASLWLTTKQHIF